MRSTSSPAAMLYTSTKQPNRSLRPSEIIYCFHKKLKTEGCVCALTGTSNAFSIKYAPSLNFWSVSYALTCKAGRNYRSDAVPRPGSGMRTHVVPSQRLPTRQALNVPRDVHPRRQPDLLFA